MQLISKKIITREGEDQFQIRLNKDEGVGLVTTHSGKHYLILDSINYWFELIQHKYPGKIKCNCQNEWFTLQFEYVPRKDATDIQEVNVITTCTACNTTKNQACIDIGYSPTHQLIENPLTFCAQPDIKYNFSEINCYWTHEDVKKFLVFMSTELRSHIYCWFWQRSDDRRHLEKVSVEKACEIITIDHRYFNFYFTQSRPDFETRMYHEDVIVKEDQWKRQELIDLAAPIVSTFDEEHKGLLFYINFCTQYINKGMLMNKSEDFKLFTTRVVQWLKENYTAYRGTDCYDNPEEHNRIFGDRYSGEKAGNI